MILSEKVKAEENEFSSITITDDGQEYGTLFGAPYSEIDDSQWLTLELGGRGLRIVNEEGDDVVLIDQFGAVYIDGQRIHSQQQTNDSEASNTFSYGFMYFLIMIALLLGGYNLIAKRKI